MKALKKVNSVLKKLEKHHVNEYAIQCAYYVILSFIPFLILLFSTLQYTNIGKDAIYFMAENIIPGNISDFVENVIKEASFKSIGTLSLSIVFTLWSAGKGFFALCKGFHYIYETPKEYNYWYLKLKSIICIIIFIIITMAALFLIAFGRNTVDFIENKYKKLSATISFILNWRAVWQCIALFLLFWLMYKYVPNHRVKFKSQIYGAAFAAIGWYVISYFFSMYLKIFKGFSVVYGSLTSIILLMIWVYWCMYILLLGAEINAFMEQKNKKEMAK